MAATDVMIDAREMQRACAVNKSAPNCGCVRVLVVRWYLHSNSPTLAREQHQHLFTRTRAVVIINRYSRVVFEMHDVAVTHHVPAPA